MKTPPKLAKIRTAHGITEYRLSNGLRVLYKRERSAPVVAVCVTFHVGSRNEAAGHTGATHILEHLLFKDTKKFNQQNGKAITDYLEWFGALMNATTWVDRTNYFELLPREHLDEALAVEADRMRNSLFDDADLASEMTVVRNEYERSRNNPFELLEEELWATAFRVHPYRIPTIGLKEDIEGSTAAKLREFYDQFYWPNNATLTVFGDVGKEEVERAVLKYFGAIPASPTPIPTMDAVEPPQEEARTVVIEKPMGATIAALTYKIPPATDPSFPAVYMLGTILAGGFSSRLQKKLVDAGLASDLAVSVPALRDPGALFLTAHVADGIDPNKVLTIMRRELRAARSTAPSPKEVARARERILTQLAFERDGVFIEVRALSEALAAGDWTLGYRMEELVQRLKPSDILRAAKQCLAPTQETAGILLNKEPAH